MRKKSENFHSGKLSDDSECIFVGCFATARCRRRQIQNGSAPRAAIFSQDSSDDDEEGDDQLDQQPETD